MLVNVTHHIHSSQNNTETVNTMIPLSVLRQFPEEGKEKKKGGGERPNQNSKSEQTSKQHYNSTYEFIYKPMTHPAQ